MRFYPLLLALALPCFAVTLKDVLIGAAKSDAVSSKIYTAKAYKKAYEGTTGKLYPRIDVSYRGIDYSEQPSMTVNLPPLLQNTKMVNAPKNYYEGEITVRYPLFRGFAIDSAVQKAKLEAKKGGLEADDTKRNIYAKAVSLYFGIVSLKKSEEAYDSAAVSALESLKKAQAMFKEGLIGAYDVENIKSKYHEIQSGRIGIKNQKESLINTLYRISGLRFDGVLEGEGVYPVQKSEIMSEALEKREDVLAVKTVLEIGDEEIRGAKSGFYPNIDVVAGIKRAGDTPRLNGDGFTNQDKSYAAVSASMNIFDGFESTKAVEAARAKRMAAELFYLDYKNGVQTEIENLFLELESAKQRVEALNQNVKSATEFYRLTNARFDNRLVGADELSRSIADLATANSRLAAEQNRVYELGLRILLESSLKNFENKLRLP